MFAHASSVWTALPSGYIEGSMMKKKKKLICGIVHPPVQID